MNNPHVVYIITKLELGGAQKVCLSLFEGLPNQGISCSLISGTQGPLVSRVCYNPRAHLLASLTREVSARGILAELRCMKDLIWQLRTLKKKYPNLIVHTHSTKAGLIGRWAALFAGVKHRVHTIHGYGFHPHQNKIAWAATYLLELITSFITTQFVCVSDQDQQTGISLFPRFAKKNSLIRAAVSWHEQPKPASVPSEHAPFIIGTIACFKPQKNIFDLLRAFERVHYYDPRARLEIIGDGILRHDIESWIVQHQLQSFITLHGFQDNVIPIMQSWHLFALTSLWEGLPCAIVEARMLKLPVVSYDTGGIREIIHHGKNGFLYPQHEWRNVSEAIEHIMHNETLYNQLRNYSDSLKDFLPQSMILNHQKLYQSLHAR